MGDGEMILMGGKEGRRKGGRRGRCKRELDVDADGGLGMVCLICRDIC